MDKALYKLSKDVLIQILLKRYELSIEEVYEFKKACNQIIRKEEIKRGEILTKEYEIGNYVIFRDGYNSNTYFLRESKNKNKDCLKFYLSYDKYSHRIYRYTIGDGIRSEAYIASKDLETFISKVKMEVKRLKMNEEEFNECIKTIILIVQNYMTVFENDQIINYFYHDRLFTRDKKTNEQKLQELINKE